ncbi:MAG: restriction system-associated AAA family ATPase [Methylobacter sp.]|uniref:restriction system-associated AAA family ATPase n=1 Tax=Methylobacter sp. TaxID=2051955 RepID=UPI00273155DB|nr:restriction system-associated AAA family ATPase [Methylobacter sp.]MDP1665792.1 restriction system-associated AAA family ATPase [Methylobacter sp.]
MKLLRLKLNEPFRSLQAGFELHFLREWDRSESADVSDREFAPYILAGPNGSGKSNVLEVLAAIFYHIECQHLTYRPETFAFDEETNPQGFKEEYAQPNAFELEYLIPTPERLQEGGADLTAHIKIVKTPDSGAQLFWINHPGFGEEKPLSRIDAVEMLPDFVLAYSSGENEILSLPFFKMRFIQLDEYLDTLKQDLPYAGSPESRQIYLDNAFSQAILLCNLLFEDDETLAPFKQDVGIGTLQEFRIILKNRIEISAEQANLYPEDFLIVEETETEVKSYFLPILKKFESEPDSEFTFEPVINRLRRCATSYFQDDETGCLYLDYLVNDATREAFKNNFESAIDLFQSFRILLTLNLYSVSDSLKKDLYRSDSLYANETIPTLPSDERIMRFKFVKFNKTDVPNAVMLKDLSDGEHQFLHSLGLCLLFKNSNSLFLLDEPETHFNPDWRSKFISRLRDCFKPMDSKLDEKNVQREMLITTHTPFLISDSKPEQVLVFTKEDGIVDVKRPDYNTLGASVDQITMLTFNKSSTIGGYAEDKLHEMQRRFEAGEDKNALIKEINKQLGDSVEKMLLIRTILDGRNKEDV